MGSGCINKVSVRVENPESKTEFNKTKDLANKGIEHIRKKKSQLFNTDISESSFAELTTPRSGKLTK